MAATADRINRTRVDIGGFSEELDAKEDAVEVVVVVVVVAAVVVEAIVVVAAV
jgi:hypothetical protein